MRVVLGTDHGGFHLKQALLARLKRAGHSVSDVGTDSPEPCDYPLIGAKVGSAVSRGVARQGILLCKSGGGMAIVANKFPNVRAVVCSSPESARHAREHNDANVLVLGAEGMNHRQALVILNAWLRAFFTGGRHARRIRQIRRMEQQIRSGRLHV